LEEEGAGLNHLDEMGERADFRGENKDGEIVVGHEAFGGSRELTTDRVEEVGAEDGEQEAGEEGKDLV
jgi:hypothetical protein